MICPHGWRTTNPRAFHSSSRRIALTPRTSKARSAPGTCCGRWNRPTERRTPRGWFAHDLVALDGNQQFHPGVAKDISALADWFDRHQLGRK